ncbi:MAG: hypothetical protein K1060chlam2_00205 [Chlamydiae bacterium]|nr:hypothetical protein [Chlamydiota bacterium]
MAIYDLLEHVEKQEELSYHISEMKLGGDDSIPESHIFSSIAARLFFFMLLIADIAWGAATAALFLLSLIGNLLTGFKLFKLKKYFLRRWLNLKRAFVCGVSLFVALFTPALGTMFACTYFLMYDKKGIDEVVPSVLQDQFKEFLSPSQ